MFATKLKGQITPNRKLIVEIPRDMEPGAVEVILLHEAPAKAAKPTRRKTVHPAFGLWAKRIAVNDSADYAAQLRQQIEQGADRRG
jgi:hypothetical protein